MDITITPGCTLLGSVNLPGDKSLSHRAALFGAMAQGVSVIDNFLVSGVTQVMLDALTSLGIAWELHENRLVIMGKGLRGFQTPKSNLYCGNSATTMRLLAGALATTGIPVILDGSSGLRRRPMNRIIAPLKAMGVPIRGSEAGTAPLTLEARALSNKLVPLEYTLPVASAQVKTCLLLAALAADGPSVLREPEVSRDHTERMLASMGVDVQNAGRQVRINPGAGMELSPLNMTLPGDISSAAFLIVAALITPGSHILLRDVLLNPTRTGLIDALLAMDADVQISNRGERAGEPVGDISVRHSALHGTQIDGGLAVRMIDEFPAFAVAAVFAQGNTLVCGAEELRHKESDRIAAMVQELRLLGADVSETTDGFQIQGSGWIDGGEVSAHGDHRLALALAVAGLPAREPVIVRDAEIISESFPGFFAALEQLGAHIHTVG